MYEGRADFLVSTIRFSTCLTLPMGSIIICIALSFEPLRGAALYKIFMWPSVIHAAVSAGIWRGQLLQFLLRGPLFFGRIRFSIEGFVLRGLHKLLEIPEH